MADTQLDNINRMNRYNDMLVMNLSRVLKSIKDNVPSTFAVSKNATKLLEALDNKELDVMKISNIIQKVYTTLGANVSYLETRNTAIFHLMNETDGKKVKITIIPGIDLGTAFNNISDEQEKNRIWGYLASMFYASVKLLYIVNPENINKESITYVSKNAINIDPFGGLEGGELTTDGIKQDLDSLPQESPMSGIMGSLGLEKMFDMNDLSKQLSNINSSDFEQATQNILELLGDGDEGTSKNIKMMMEDIQKEMTSKDLSKSANPMDSIINIAENVANRLKNKVDPKTMDMNKLLKSTTKMADGLKDSNGNPVFNGGNPLEMLTKMMQAQANNSSK